ncbi:MAG: M28 family peptidase [Acidobacteriota bacterium]
MGRMRCASAVVAAALAGWAGVSAGEPPRERLAGFTEQGSAAQRELEARFDERLRADNLREWMKRMTARPHHTGSPYGRELAEFTAGLFRSWGYETAIERFEVLFPTPRERVVELLAPVRFRARLTEPPLAEDSTSAQQAEHLPIYNAFSVDGDVTGELVYVNYGLPADYEALQRRGIDVRGRIVLARYGGSWRGIKPKVAAEQGAIGCILYSDPREDGFFQGDPYPKGGYRTADGAQRGSVMDMPVHPGDPLTPGIGATADAPRLTRDQARTLTRIPVLPISASDARPLLDALAGPVAPEGWRGALPLTYHIGPGPARVRLKVAFDWKPTPVHDVIARLPGKELSDQWVMRGNHYDAWVHGATDPVGGAVALLEEARVIGELARQGWRPRRTIVFALWDGEEQGLLGSTEWVETHAAELADRLAVYVNTDSYSRGFLGMGGSGTLEAMANQAAREVLDPERAVDLVARAKARTEVSGGPEAWRQVRERADVPLSALGAGSDYTPFLHHLGVACLDLGIGGEGQYGQYHSNYDSFDHFTRFVDPEFAYGVTLAKVAGRMTMRLASADVLPFDFAPVAESLRRWVGEIESAAARMREETAEHNRRVAEGTYLIAADPASAYVPPGRLDEVPHFNFAPLHNALERLDAAVEAWRTARASGATPASEAAAALDRRLMAAERAFTRPEGLPGRPWYRHFVLAPGVYAGYGVRTLPVPREALEQRRFAEVDPGVVVTARAIEAYAAAVEHAAALLASAR